MTLNKYQQSMESLYASLPDTDEMKKQVRHILDDPTYSNLSLIDHAKQTLQFVAFVLHARQYKIEEVLERVLKDLDKKEQQTGE